MRAVFTVVMASIALSTTNYAMAQKSVSPPDFAYPKTVSANAKKALEKALAKNDGIFCPSAPRHQESALAFTLRLAKLEIFRQLTKFYRK